MPTRSRSSGDPQNNRRSTEHYGLGQSGYTAGRREDDPSLNIEARNQSYPRGFDEHKLDGPDERWIGRGGAEWVSDPRAEEEKRSEGEQPAQPQDKRSSA